MIEGYTDDVGSNSYNKILSEKRAKSVYNFLINKGIAIDRLSYIGIGKFNSKIEKDESIRKLNRKVTFKIIAI